MELRPHTGIRVCGPIFTRFMEYLPAGFVVDGHQHNFDHVTTVPKGSARIECSREITDKAGNPILDANGEPQLWSVWTADVGPGVQILINKQDHHRIVALEDNTWIWCEFTARTPDGEIAQEHTGWGPGNE